MDEPSGAKCGLTVVEQILAVVHQQNLVLFIRVVVVGRREVDAALSCVVQYFGRDVGFVNYFVSSRIEARVNLDAFRSSFEYIVAAEHPTAIVE